MEKDIRILVSNIEWDTDGEDIDLPSEVLITNPNKEMVQSVEDNDYADEIGDFLSDEYGFCLYGFTADLVVGEVGDAIP